MYRSCGPGNRMRLRTRNSSFCGAHVAVYGQVLVPRTASGIFSLVEIAVNRSSPNSLTDTLQGSIHLVASNGVACSDPLPAGRRLFPLPCRLSSQCSGRFVIIFSVRCHCSRRRSSRFSFFSPGRCRVLKVYEKTCTERRTVGGTGRSASSKRSPAPVYPASFKAGNAVGIPVVLEVQVESS